MVITPLYACLSVCTGPDIQIMSPGAHEGAQIWGLGGGGRSRTSGAHTAPPLAIPPPLGGNSHLAQKA